MASPKTKIANPDVDLASSINITAMIGIAVDRNRIAVFGVHVEVSGIGPKDKTLVTSVIKLDQNALESQPVSFARISSVPTEPVHSLQNVASGRVPNVEQRT